MTWKEEINLFVINNYSDLDRICKNNSKGHNWNSDDLLSELVIYLLEKEEKVKEFLSEDNSMIRFCSTWCYNQVNVYKKYNKNSNFRSKFDLRCNNEIIDSPDESDNFSNPVLDEFEIDLLRVYNENQVDKIKFAKEFINKLTESEKHLFKLHFEDGMSHYKISNYFRTKYNIKVSNSSIYNSIVKLRKKIKESYDNHN